MTLLDAPVEEEEVARPRPEATAMGHVAPQQRVTPPSDGDEGDGEDLDAAEFVEPPLPPFRVGLVVGASTLAAAVVVGAVFDSVAGHVVPALAGIVGIGVAAQASRRRRAIVVNLTIGLGIIGTGLALLLPDVGNITHVVALLREAGHARHVLRPPAQFLPGFRLIVGWLMRWASQPVGWGSNSVVRDGD